jgi:hypothetical protein
MVVEKVTSAPGSLVEGEDYYWEGEAMVFTERYHLRRGYCCESGCRHCPYGETGGTHRECLGSGRNSPPSSDILMS